MNVFELKVMNRMFTLYTEDNLLMEKFYMYFEHILELVKKLREIQRENDL
jgi:hypothetical protein